MNRPQLHPSPGPARTLCKALFSEADRLGVRGRTLADIVGTSEATISRLRAAGSLDPSSKQGELALLFLRLFRSLDALVGGDDAQAAAWLRAENHHVRGVPVERIRTVEGLVDVVQYLDAMRGRL